jgi:hypothetical protein
MNHNSNKIQRDSIPHSISSYSGVHSPSLHALLHCTLHSVTKLYFLLSLCVIKIRATFSVSQPVYYKIVSFVNYQLQGKANFSSFECDECDEGRAEGYNLNKDLSRHSRSHLIWLSLKNAPTAKSNELSVFLLHPISLVTGRVTSTTACTLEKVPSLGLWTLFHTTALPLSL